MICDIRHYAPHIPIFLQSWSIAIRLHYFYRCLTTQSYMNLDVSKSCPRGFAKPVYEHPRGSFMLTEISWNSFDIFKKIVRKCHKLNIVQINIPLRNIHCEFAMNNRSSVTDNEYLILILMTITMTLKVKEQQLQLLSSETFFTVGD